MVLAYAAARRRVNGLAERADQLKKVIVASCPAGRPGYARPGSGSIGCIGPQTLVMDLKGGMEMSTPKRGSGALGLVVVATLAVALQTGALLADEAPPPPPPDTVTSKGTVLRGKVTGLSADGLTLEPEYGKGSVAIKWVNIEDVKTSGNFQVLYGDGEELDAPLQGLSGGNLMVGTDPATATPVDIKSIFVGVPIGPEGPSWMDRMRSDWRYWDGSFDAAVNIQQATTDTTGFLLGFETTRKHAPTRFILGANYRYSTQKKKGEDSTTIEDRAYGLIRGEYDITSRLYGFASGDATYDAIQQLSIRGVPKVGLGYLFWEEKLDEDRRNFLSGEVGPGWVYEKYFHNTGKKIGPTPPVPPAVQLWDDTRDYYTIAFGAAAGYYLPYGAHAGWRLDYLPSADSKWATNYLVRNELTLTMPVIGVIGAKFSLIDEYNNNPAADATRNSLYLTFGLSVLW